MLPLSEQTLETACHRAQATPTSVTMSDSDKTYSEEITWTQGEDNSGVKCSLRKKNKISLL